MLRIGVQGHVSKDCPRKQKTATTSSESEAKKETAQVTSLTEPLVVDNEYLKLVDFEILRGATNFCFRLDTQFDTASPISLIKESLIPCEWIKEMSYERYEGINGSILRIKGIVKVKISYDGEEIQDVTLRIVSDGTLRNSALLGRDTLRRLGVKLIKVTNEKISVIEGEILNIETGVFEGSEIDKIDVNEEMSSEIKEKVKDEIRVTYLEAKRSNVQRLELS